MVTGVVLSSAVFLELDPFYIVVCLIYKLPSPWWFTLLRFIHVLWCTLEATRTFATILTAAVTIFNVTCGILENFAHRRRLSESIVKYRQIQVLTATGQLAIREAAGMLMAAGFIIAISSNYVVISGYRTFPLFVYLCFVLVNIVTYVVISQTLPLIVKCHDISSYSCGCIWHRKLLTGNFAVPGRTFRLLRKIIRSQRPITFYYGTAEFDPQTKRNFYRNIAEFTINLLLF